MRTFISSLFNWVYIVLVLCCFGCESQNKPKAPAQSPAFLETKTIQGGKIWSLDWSPNDRLIACGNATGLLRIYDANSLNLVQVLSGLNHTINGIHWSPDGQKIIASGGHEDPRVMLWDLENESRIIIDDHNRQVRSVRWSPKGNYFASTSHDGTIRVWTPKGEFVKIFSGANGGCVGIDWLDEDVIAASCWDNTIRTYSVSGQDSLLIENGNHRRKAVLSVDWHPNGNMLASGDYGNDEDTVHAVKIWDSKGQLLTEMTSHEKEIRSLAWNPKGELLASGGETIRLWDKSGKLEIIFKENSSPVWSLDWNSKGDQLVSGHNDGKVRFWDVDGNLLRIIDGHSSETSSVAYNADSTTLFWGFSDGSLRSFNTENMSSKTVTAHSRSVLNLKLSPDQTKIAMGSNDGTCSIRTIQNGEITGEAVYFGEEFWTKDIAWSDNSTLVVFLDYDNKVSVFSANGEFQYSLENNGENFKSVQWKNDKPQASEQSKDESKPLIKYVVMHKGEYVKLIPLSNNEFALIDKEGEVVFGSKSAFINIVKLENGFTRIQELD